MVDSQIPASLGKNVADSDKYRTRLEWWALDCLLWAVLCWKYLLLLLLLLKFDEGVHAILISWLIGWGWFARWLVDSDEGEEAAPFIRSLLHSVIRHHSKRTPMSAPDEAGNIYSYTYKPAVLWRVAIDSIT